MIGLWFCVLCLSIVVIAWGVLILMLNRELEKAKERISHLQNARMAQREDFTRLLMRVCQLERVTVKRDAISALAAWYNSTDDEDYV